MYKFFITHKKTFFGVIFLVLFSVTVSFATPDANTLDPNCAPTDPSCFPVISGATSYTFSTGFTDSSNTITNNLSTGISGGQSVIGGTASGNNLTLSSTSNATKGKILFGTSTYDEVNNRLGIGTTTPGYTLDVVGTLHTTGVITLNTLAITQIGTRSISIGAGAPLATTDSFFVGNGTGQGASSASYSNFLGFLTGVDATNASYSNFLGFQAGGTATNASDSNFIGVGSGYDATNANNSNFFGTSAGSSATDANNSNFFGTSAGSSATDASYSNLFGYRVGLSFTNNNIGSNNIIIGTNISLPNTTTNAINLGGILFGTGAYSTTAGNPAITAVSGGKIGIGIVSPNHTLDVNGNIGIVTSGYINFSSTDGVLGYGIRDNTGTLQYKNSGGSWTSFSSGGGAAAWGNISGTLSSQTDLQTALNAKQNALTNPITGTGTSGQIAFWNGTTTQTSSSNLLWSEAGYSLTVKDSVSNPTGAVRITGTQIQFDASTNIAQGYLSYDTDAASLQTTSCTTCSNRSFTYLDSIGNFGIGTTSPSHYLDVVGNIGISSGGYLNFSQTDGVNGYGIRDNAGTIQYKNLGGSWTSFSSGGGGSLAIGSAVSSGTDKGILFIDSSGNLAQDDGFQYDTDTKSFTFGFADTGGVISTGNTAAFARGIAQGGGHITASEIGSVAWGISNNSNILASGAASFVFGSADNDGYLNASNNNSFVFGGAHSGSIVTNGEGSLAFGVSGGGQIYTGGQSSLAFGTVDNLWGTKIYTNGDNSLAFGSASSGASIYTTGSGIAHGDVSGEDGNGNFSHINASIGAYASGYATGGGYINASGQSSLIHGTVDGSDGNSNVSYLLAGESAQVFGTVYGGAYMNASDRSLVFGTAQGTDVNGNLSYITTGSDADSAWGAAFNGGYINTSGTASQTFGYSDGVDINGNVSYLQTGGIGSFTFGNATAGGYITSINPGSLTFGYASGGLSTVTGLSAGGFVGGYAESAGTIRGSGLGSFVFGLSVGTSSLLTTTEDGAFAIGYSAADGVINSSGTGSFAGGVSVNAGLILADDGAAFTFGYADNGAIVALSQGAFAGGAANNGFAISSTGEGSFTFGKATDGDIINAGIGSIVVGGILENNSNYGGIFGQYGTIGVNSNNSFLFALGGNTTTLSTPNTFAVGYAGNIILQADSTGVTANTLGVGGILSATLPSGSFGTIASFGANGGAGLVTIGYEDGSGISSITGSGFGPFQVASSANNNILINPGSGNVGIKNISPSYTLDVGDSSVSGIVAQFTNSSGSCTINPTTSSVGCTSDIRLKKNITILGNTNPFILSVIATSTNDTILQKIISLTPVTYNWNIESDTDQKHTGFIAQQVEQVFPDLVATDQTTGFKTLNYMGFAPYTIKAIQELDIKINSISNLVDTSNTLRTGIALWFADTQNGIQSIFAKEGHFEEKICIGEKDNETCITKEVLDRLLQQQNQGGGAAPAPAPIVAPDEPVVDIVPASDEPVVDVLPAPEVTPVEPVIAPENSIQ